MPAARHACPAGAIATAHGASTSTSRGRRVKINRDAVGAILKFAVTAQVAGISIPTVGVILMLVGTVGLIARLWVILAGRAAPEL